MADFETLLATRSAADYAAFFLPYLRDDMTLLDCGCGPGSITYGLAERIGHGQVVGLDAGSGFRLASDYAHPRPNLSFVHGDVNAIPFADATFDAVFAHSLVETLSSPISALREMRRAMKEGGVIGLAAVDYSGVLIGGPETGLPERFYALRERWWIEQGIAEPRRGKHLRSLLADVDFRHVTASARYIAYGDAVGVRRFGEDRARECEDGDMARSTVELGLCNKAELGAMASAWRAWGESPGAFLAFPWCSAIGWK